MSYLLPRAGQMLPDFSLPSSDGATIHLSDFRQRKDLVIVFLSGKDSDLALLRGLAREYDLFVEQGAQVMAVARGDPARAVKIKRQLNLPYPLLIDAEGKVFDIYSPMDSRGETRLAIYVADRYGEIFYAFQDDGGAPIPGVKDLLDWVIFAEAQCPE